MNNMAINAGSIDSIEDKFIVFYLEEAISTTASVIAFDSQGDIRKDIYTVNPATDGFPTRGVVPVTFGAGVVTETSGREVGLVKKATGTDPIIGFYNGDASFAPNEAPYRYGNVKIASGATVIAALAKTSEGTLATSIAYGDALDFVGDDGKRPVIDAAGSGAEEPVRRAFALNEVLAADLVDGKVIDVLIL
jgi:hypothetical protein